MSAHEFGVVGLGCIGVAIALHALQQVGDTLEDIHHG